MALEQRPARFRNFIEAWTRRRLETVDDLMRPDVTYHLPPFPDLEGAEAVKQFIANFNSAFPNDFQVIVDEDLATESATVHRWHVSGTYTGESPLMPVPPTGRHATATGCHICHWVEDKCAEVWHFGDWLGWLQGAGVIPPMDKLK
jgi:predicted ester cyclase